jgi:hypothetical protein
MKKPNKPLWTVIISVMLCVVACVTVNIYFPAEKVESVAEDIVGDIRGKEPQETPDDGKTSLLQRSFVALTCSVAWAEDAVTVSNATIRALKEQMKNRYAQMKPYYQQGRLVEGDNGYVSEGNTARLGLKDRRDLKNLVEAENEDRSSLYREVAKALDIDPSQVNRIAEIFAKEWKKK